MSRNYYLYFFHFLLFLPLFQRAAFMDNRRSGVHADIDCPDICASRCNLRSAFVEDDKFFEVELFACIALDALHDALATDCAVVGYVVVHAAVLL